MVKAHELLTAEELAYIRRVLGAEADGPLLHAPSYEVHGDADATLLLSRLSRIADLHLQAQIEDRCLSFPLRLDEDDFQQLRLTLGAPCIDQDGPVQRPWRLALEQPLRLLDTQDGAGSGLWVRELSPTGVLLQRDDALEYPQRFSLWLSLPEQRALHLQGERVRLTREGYFAYRLQDVRDTTRDALRQFIFEQHQRRFSLTLSGRLPTATP